MHKNKVELYSALVWLIPAIAIFSYSLLISLGWNVPGIEQLVDALSQVTGYQVYIAAFISIFIEGLYFIGGIFPGSGIVLVLAILSQLKGTVFFITVIITIFVGWCIAGAINILIAKFYRHRILLSMSNQETEIKDRPWLTWFPAFRSNYEVAQIIEKADPWGVFLSSVRVKLWASSVMAICALIIPLFIRINEIENDEGRLIFLIVGSVMFVVGSVKVRKYVTQNKDMK